MQDASSESSREFSKTWQSRACDDRQAWESAGMEQHSATAQRAMPVPAVDPRPQCPHTAESSTPVMVGVRDVSAQNIYVSYPVSAAANWHTPQQPSEHKASAEPAGQ